MAQLKDTVVSGNLRVTDTALTNTAQVTTIKAPTSSGGSTYGPGTDGQVLKSNGTSVYWTSDNNSDTKVNVTLATTTKAYLLGTSTTPTASAQAVTSVADTGVYLDTTAGQLTATKLSSKVIKNALTGSGTAGSDSSGTYYPAKWTFNSGITIADGEVVIIKIPVAGHTNGVYVSVNNGTNYYPVAATGSTRLTTHYDSGQFVALMFKSDGSVSDMFPLAGGTSRTTISGGSWIVLNFYDSGNTYTSAYCTTAAGTAAKTATCSSYVLLNKSWLHVLMTASNTANSALTLNVNGKGAKPIYINGSASSSSNYSLPAGTYLVYYDGTNYYFRTDGVLTGTATSGHTHGNITNAGAITTTADIASGDRITIVDSSNSSKLTGSSITFDGATTNKCLTQKGTWESFTNNAGTVTGSGLTADTIILGNANSAIKTSSTTIATSTTGVTDVDTTVPTSKAVKSFVEGKGYTTNTGTVTGSGLTADTIITGNGGVDIKTSSKTIATSISDVDTTVPTSKAVKTFVEGKGYTTNTGTVIGSSLTADTIITGNGGVNVKTSSKTIATSVTDVDTTVPTSKAVKTYVDGLVANATHFKGGFAASGDGTIDGGSTTLKSVAEAVGDMYTCTTAGTIYGIAFEVGDSIIFRKAVAAGTAPATASGTPLTSTDFITVEGETSVSVVVPDSSSVTWNTEKTIATVEGTAIKLTIPSNPVPSNNVTGSGTSGYIAKWTGTNTVTNGPAFGSDTTKYLRNDGTWVAPPNDNTWTAMVGATSSANGSVGYVNAVPPKDGYNTKYLRADGTWTVPPDNNTWTAMVGATSSANGSVGYVNAVPPKDGYNTKYLRADGTWVVPPNDNTKNTAGSTDTSSRIFLIGATSQAANPQTYSHDTAYVGTDGHLYSNSKQVVNLSDSQALTNKTYNGYTLAAACAKGVTDNSTSTAVTSSDTNLITGRTLYYAGYAKVTFDTTNEMMIFT